MNQHTRNRNHLRIGVIIALLTLLLFAGTAFAVAAAEPLADTPSSPKTVSPASETDPDESSTMMSGSAVATLTSPQSTTTQSTAKPTTDKPVSVTTYNLTILIIIVGAVVLISLGTLLILRMKRRPEKTNEAAVNHAPEQKEIHLHVNGNVYSDVGIVASDNAVVNRASVNTDSTKKCPYCGTELRSDDKFCSKCGKEL